MGVWEPELGELRAREAMAERMGGVEKVARQHDRGKLDVRQRITALLDEGSFHEIGKIAGSPTYDGDGELVDLRASNFLFGRGRIDGRTVVVAADDFTVRGGAADAAIIGKQIAAEKMSGSSTAPAAVVRSGRWTPTRPRRSPRATAATVGVPAPTCP